MLSSDTIAGGKGSQVTLNLIGTNELVTTEVFSAGLTVEDSTRLIIEGTGSLLAQGAGNIYNSGGAGIGGSYDKAAGTVIIQSGTVTATGGFASAGIGGGAYRTGGSITVAGGTITATAGMYAAGIGGGYSGNGGSITVTDGTITSTGGDAGAGIGGGTDASGGNITVTGGKITATGGSSAAGIGGGYAGNGGNITHTGGTITAMGGAPAAGIGGGAGSGSGGHITVTGGKINATGGAGGAGIGGGWSSAGNITISGGTINATGGQYGAGIGGGAGGGSGNIITIRGGVVVAVSLGGQGDPAGIGGGGSSNAGMVTITGGTVYASGGTGAGIGGGSNATEGNINITGGIVIADEIGIGAIGQPHESRTATNISGANTVVLSPSINTTTFGQAKVLTGDSVHVSDTITIGDTIADVTLNAALTIPSGATLVVPAGIVFDVNNKALTNNGIIREYGSLLNKGSLTGNQALGAIQASWITIPNQTNTYTGDSIKPTVTVTNGTLTLAHGVDYSVAYTNNVNAGTATATITDLGDSYHTVTKTFTIAPKPLAAGCIQDISPLPYTGDSITPAVVVKDGDKTLTLNTDYTVSYTNNLNQGTATATVTGMGNYTGSAGKTFVIVKQIAAGWMEALPAQTYPYTGDSIMPTVVVRDDSNPLTLNTDYTVAYTNNVNAGTAMVTVTGMGNYAGTKSKMFSIVSQPTDTVPADTVPTPPPADTVSKAVTGVSFYNDSYIVEKGKTLQLFAAIEPADAGNRNVSWATSNRAVATISAGGRVTAVSAGEATITVTTAAGGYRDTCLIRVPGIVTTKDTVIYQKTIFYERDTLYRDTTVYRTDTLYTDTVHRVDTLYRDTTLYRTDTLYRDTTVCRTDTLYNNIVINVVDTVQVDSINYTLVPDTVYVVTDITGAEHAVTAAAPVVRVGTVLRIESLTPGKTFGIYRVTGEKLYSGTAQTDVFRLDNIPAGVYILYHAGQYSKFAY
ncbi:MAG: Ig-like domain-containing protein [Bacteroidales bacterium]